MSDFIVETDELSSSESSDEQKPSKKNVKAKARYRRVVAPSTSSSETDSRGTRMDKVNKNRDQEPSSSEESDFYGQDLQLFYIRMNNRKDDEAKK